MNVWKLSTVALAGALATTIGFGHVSLAQAEPQPHMQAALSALKVAKEQLEKASHDKGGHRVKALGHTKDAIEQVQKGIAFDDKH
ncbi:MAG: hypothetical protein IPG50_31850 [Myxococcales bacterium]|nr:hypothetical protein [Myxococcales bacterium]